MFLIAALLMVAQAGPQSSTLQQMNKGTNRRLRVTPAPARALAPGLLPEKVEIDEVFLNFNLQKGSSIYLGKKLGEGSYGQVFEAFSSQDRSKKIGVVKVMGFSRDKELDARNIEVRNKMPNGGKVLARISTTTGGRKKLGLLMEAYDSDLQKENGKCAKLSQEETNTLWSQMSDSLSQIHSLGYQHGDIKPSNIMQLADAATSAQNYFMVDFGLMKPRSEVGVLADYYNLFRIIRCVQNSGEVFVGQLHPNDKYPNTFLFWDDLNGKALNPNLSYNDMLNDDYWKKECPIKNQKSCNAIISKVEAYPKAIQGIYANF